MTAAVLHRSAERRPPVAAVTEILRESVVYLMIYADDLRRPSSALVDNRTRPLVEGKIIQIWGVDMGRLRTCFLL